LAGIAIASVFILTPLTYLCHGYTLSKLWEWFATPLGLPVLTIAHAAGVLLIAKFVMYGRYSKTHALMEQAEKDGNYSPLWGYSISYIFIPPAVGLGIGWVIKSFM